MSALIQSLNNDLKTAMKSADAARLTTLKLLLSAIHNKEIEKRTRLAKETKDISELEKSAALNEEEIITVILGEIKKRKDAVLAYETANRFDLAAKEKQEIEILKPYAPQEMSEEELRAVVKQKIAELKPRSLQDLGKVMGRVMAEVRGKAGGDLVKKIAEEELEK